MDHRGRRGQRQDKLGYNSYSLRILQVWVSRELNCVLLRYKKRKAPGHILIHMKFLDEILDMVDNLFREVQFCSFSVYHRDHN